MKKLTPAIRLSLGLVFLTLSIIVVAQGLGLIPNLERQHLSAREQIAENLTLQATLAIKRNDQALIRQLFDNTTSQNPNILSMALYKNSGQTVYQTTTHSRDWQLPANEQSTPRYMRIPVNISGVKKGLLEIAFTPLSQDGAHIFGIPHFALLVLFVCLSGFTAFWFYIKRVLQQLDPTSVVPARVRNALNIMAEGVLIMDKRQQIVLANESILKLLDLPDSKLVGRKADELGWEEDERSDDISPWQKAQESNEQCVNARMAIRKKNDQKLVFKVNAIPIKDDRGKPQGIIASFNNVTELEQKSRLLKDMIKSLAEKQRAIEVKNEELKHLASRDPLTNCYNRRTLFDLLNKYFEQPNAQQTHMCVIMSDIDKFKNINDTYGHNFGDETIQTIAQTLKTHSRDEDTVARFGGEEFCIVLPHTTLETAANIAETCRAAIEAKPIKGVKITSSFGIASIQFGAETPTDLIHLADQALYQSKEDGRNRCTVWSPNDNIPEASDVAG